jgi:hypothetical protein
LLAHIFAPNRSKVIFARALAVKSVCFLLSCTLLDLMWSFKNAFLDTDCIRCEKFNFILGSTGTRMTLMETDLHPF